jgi:hypothetical protein
MVLAQKLGPAAGCCGYGDEHSRFITEKLLDQLLRNDFPQVIIYFAFGNPEN